MFERAAAEMIASAYEDFPNEDGDTVQPSEVSFGGIRPDKLADPKGGIVWLVPFEIQVGYDKQTALNLQKHILDSLAKADMMEKMSKHEKLQGLLKPEVSEIENIAKELKKKHKRDKDQKKKADDISHEDLTDPDNFKFKVPISPVTVRKKTMDGIATEIVDPRCTIVDDPCTYKVAKGIDTVLVAMSSHKENVDVQHCAAHLIRWIVAWGDAEVAQVIVQADALDEIKTAMKFHPKHKSLINHCKFALTRIQKLLDEDRRRNDIAAMPEGEEKKLKTRALNAEEKLIMAPFPTS